MLCQISVMCVFDRAQGKPCCERDVGEVMLKSKPVQPAHGKRSLARSSVKYSRFH